MAINFPDSPGIGSVFTDATSGFSYEWTGTLWKSFTGNIVSDIQILDDISGSFDGIETTFNLTVSGSAVTPVNAQQIEIILGGIQQAPGVDYTISGSTVIFTTAPTNGLTFSGKLLGTALSLNTIAADTDGSGLIGVSTNFVSAIGIQSGGTVIGSGITQLNFVGTGNTFAVNGTTVDISIQGSGGGKFSANDTGISTTTSVGIGTTNATGAADPNNTAVLNVGVVTANFFYGTQFSGNATGLTGTPDINVGILTAGSAGSATTSYLINSTLETYSEKLIDVGNTGANYTYTLANGNYFKATLDQICTFTFDATNAPSQVYSFVIQLKNGTGGPFTITWPVSIEWPAGVTPTRTTTDGRTDIWSFITTDGGTNWLGNLNIVDYNV